MDYNGPDVRAVHLKYDPLKGSSREWVWTDDANCSGYDPDLFQVNQLGDPEVDHIPANRTDLLAKHNRAKIEEAKQVCVGCPVRATCLELASTSDLHWSVRGGQTPQRLIKVGKTAKITSIPSFPTQDYVLWSCKNCGGEEFTWQVRKVGTRYRRCGVCAP